MSETTKQINDSENAKLFRTRMDIFVLNALNERDGQGYGYDVISYIQDHTKGHYKIKSISTIYNILKRLEGEGYVSSAKGGNESFGAARVYYTLTPEGKEYLEAYKKEWKYIRTLLNNLVSDEDFDLENEEPPYSASVLKPLTKRNRDGGEQVSDSSSTDSFSSDIFSDDDVSIPSISSSDTEEESSLTVEEDSNPLSSDDESPFYDYSDSEQPNSSEQNQYPVFSSSVSPSDDDYVPFSDKNEQKGEGLPHNFDSEESLIEDQEVLDETNNNIEENNKEEISDPENQETERDIDSSFYSTTYSFTQASVSTQPVTEIEHNEEVVSDSSVTAVEEEKKPDDMTLSMSDAFSLLNNNTVVNNKTQTQDDQSRVISATAATTFDTIVSNPDAAPLSPYIAKLKQSLENEGYTLSTFNSAKKTNTIRYFYSRKIFRDASIASFLYLIVTLLLTNLFKDIFGITLLATHIISAIGFIAVAFSLIAYFRNPRRKRKDAVNLKLINSALLMVFVVVYMIIVVYYLFHSYNFMSPEMYTPAIILSTIPFSGFLYTILYHSGRYFQK